MRWLDGLTPNLLRKITNDGINIQLDLSDGIILPDVGLCSIALTWGTTRSRWPNQFVDNTRGGRPR